MRLKNLAFYLARRPVLQVVPYWLAATLVGLLAVLYANVFDLCCSIVLEIFSSNQYLLLALSPVCFFLAWFLVKKFAPHAAGSGIPQVMAAIECGSTHQNRFVKKVLGLKTALIKIASSLLCILGGGAIGREGPTIQISATIFYFLGTKANKIWPGLSHRPFIVAGGAAGVAAAFNTPLGGIIFAIEELMTAHFHNIKTVLIFAVLVAGLIAQWIMGPYLYFGFPSVAPVTFSAVPLALLVGALGGFFGALFGHLLLVITHKKSQKLKKSSSAALFALASGVVIAIIAIVFGSTCIGPGKQIITGFLFHEQTATWGMIIGRFISSIVSYISGCAGGIFAPSLAIGGALGSKLAQLAHSPDTNLMVLLGMIAFLTGVTRAPFTAFVLVLEMTDRHSAITLMMLSAVCAYGSSRIFGAHSFYDHAKAWLLEETSERGPKLLPQKDQKSPAMLIKKNS
ncbi:MAG: chloride channel protein [Myxococcales bacterium]|nr:chloride channel protein [Myxococcales bacterium]USN49909.1 MAG: chloride channel protein [Myxococcales bacterium]